MSQVDEVGAMAAARYFLELFAYVTGTGDLAEWQAVSAGDCGFCARVHDDVTRVYEADGQYVGGDVTIDGAEVLGYDAVLDGYGVGVTFAFTGGAELDSDGNTVEQKSATVGLAVIDVTHSTGEWILAGLSLRDEQPQ